MLDESSAWGFYSYDKGTYLADLSGEAIQVIAEYLPKKSSPLSLLLFYRLDGAYSEVGENTPPSAEDDHPATPSS